MHQIKIFKTLETDVGLLEKQVNAWLAESKVRVINMFGNIAPQSPPPEESAPAISKSPHPPSDVFLVVLYEQP
ncbi:MAG: hypothetical protein HYY23_14190 [Verrucomicrobia bacterium]|nr:hypothetical protein [Verrucomicrobiota bacterium]